jgi:FAD binding domain of DNA photolyase
VVVFHITTWLRMVVASFLTKHLLIGWREDERSTGRRSSTPIRQCGRAGGGSGQRTGWRTVGFRSC